MMKKCLASILRSKSYKNVLFGGGNPLLDMTAKVKTEYVLEHGLIPNSSQLASEEHMIIFEDLFDRDCDFTPGGATQNVFRCFQWMLDEGDGCSTFVGCVGEDKYADLLAEGMANDGVNTVYYVNPFQETGKCACLITQGGECRTLVADLAAAKKYEYRHFMLPKVQEKMNEAELFYVSGYFLNACSHAILDIAIHCFENEKTLGVNLSADFIIKEFMQLLLPTMYGSSYIFGNEKEARTLAKKLKFSETHKIPVIAETLVSQLPKIKGKTKRAVFTQGGDGDVIVAQQTEEGGVEILSFPIIQVENVVDTNGAGDSFCGGFLSQVAKGGSIEDCVEAGMYASRVCITTHGVIYPKDKPKI